MQIFLTGGTGFIGSYFINKALVAGHEVVALRRTPQSRPQINLTTEPVWVNKLIEDVSTKDLSGCDVLVHLASFGVSPKPSTWEDCFKVNVLDTMHLLETANDAGIRKVIAAGSCAEYGSSGLNYDFIPVDAPLSQKEPMHLLKRLQVSQFSLSLKVQECLLFMVEFFLPLERGSLNKTFGLLKKRALEGSDFEMTLGEQIRDFIPVEEVAEWFIKALEHVSLQSEMSSFWNVASGNPISIREFCENWWQKFEAKGKLLVGALQYRDAEVMRYVPEVKNGRSAKPYNWCWFDWFVLFISHWSQ